MDAGYDDEEFEETRLDPDEEKFGEFTVATSAAERYNEGEMSAATYGTEAIVELQTA